MFDKMKQIAVATCLSMIALGVLNQQTNGAYTFTPASAALFSWWSRYSATNVNTASTVTNIFTVTNTNDSGAGSLRQAMLNANAAPGTDTINFNIPGTDTGCDGTTHVCTITPQINPTGQLPFITSPVVLDGYTQPGSSVNTLANGDDAVLLIEINGASLGNNGVGLVLAAGASGSTVRGLVIDNGWDTAVLIQTDTVAVEGCFLGTDPAGAIARGNTHGVRAAFGVTTSGMRVGGTSPAARNVISGNGTGISIHSGANQLVQGNFIGTNAAGAAALANGRAINVGSSDNLIGGTTVAARNIIAGNGTVGIEINTIVVTPTGNRIQGNFIGTDVTGTTPLGFSSGVSLGISSATQIGGLTATPGTPPGNVISGSSTGIFVGVGISNNTIQGNLIGTDASGTNPLGNSAGIDVQGSSNVIGGTDVMARNVISANGRGISLGTTNATVQTNLVQGNFIGTDISGTQLLGNSDDGVFVTDSINNTIGGIVLTAGAPPGNLIAGNGGRGVGVAFGAFGVTGLAINGNSILSNGGLGIDLNRDGVTPNDPCDPDTGPNNRQNFPLLTSVNSSLSDTTIQGTLDSLADKNFRIEFFANDACDPSGNGEGQTFIGSTDVTTDGSCSASFNVTLPTSVPDGKLVTATATLLDTSTNPATPIETSEFSAWFPVGGPAILQFSSPNYNVNENGGSATINVTRTGTTGGAVTVNYATSSGTAAAGSDYTDTSGTLTFGPSETSKTFSVPIFTDALVEGDETVNLTLSNASCAGVLGAQNTAVLTIADSVPPAVNAAPTLNAISGPAPILEDAGQQTINLSGISAGASESQNLTVTALSNNTGLIPNPTVSYTSPNATGSLSYTPVANASGSAIITVTVMDDGGTANGGVDQFTRTFTVNVTAVNDAPTLNAIANPAAILEDAGQQIISLSGISAGPIDESSQALAVTAISNNTALIPNPTVTYTSPQTTGSLSYTPLANANGSAIITVTVMDNGGTPNGGVDQVTRTFTVNVTAVNDAPTLSAISDPAAILEDAGQQTINLSGISVGPINESGQALSVTALSNNTALIPNPTVTYTSPNATGSLSYTPVANASGSAIITVTVMDDGGTANGGVDQVTRTFTVNVTAVNDTPTLNAISDPAAILENAVQQTVNLAGISAGGGESQNLTVTALSNNTGLIPNPTVTYTSPNATGSLSYTPNTNQAGSAVITVTVMDDGGTANGAIDNVTRTVTVNVTLTTTYAEPSGNCGAGNTPCFTTVQAAIDALTSGGTVNVIGGTFNENVNLSSTNVTVNINANTTVNSWMMSAGILNGSNGGSFTLTLATGNWNNNGGTFNAGTGTVVFAVTGQSIGGSNPTTFNNLTIGAGGTTLNGAGLEGGSATPSGPAVVTVDATVTGVLTLTGDLTVNSPAKLIMPASAGSTGTGDVIGTVQRTGFVTAACASAPCANTLSLGNPNNQITITGGTAPTSILVNLVKSAPVTYPSAVQRNYTITPTGGSGITATVRLHYLDSELNGNTEANLNLRRLTGTWQIVLPSVVDTTNNWVECNAVTAFSQWTFASLAPTATSGSISGRILSDDGSPVEGAVVRLGGTQTRKTITDTFGNYRFSNVETSGFYTVTPSRVNYNFSPFNRSFSQLGNQTEATFGASFNGDTANPLDTPEYFVRQQYVDLLGREPDETGFNFWSDRILVCGNDADCIRSQRIAVAAEFFIHQEFQQSGAFIYNLYEGSLSRLPLFAEYSIARQRVVGGPNLEAEKQAFAESFAQRGEFTTKYQANTSADSFVDALLLNLRQNSGVDLGNQRDNLIAHYNSGANQTESRSFVLRDVTENALTRDANYNQAFVLTEYFGYLRRGPDKGGYQFWLNVLNEIGRNGDPGNYNRMVCSFITSTEYQQRFSAVVSHSNGECDQ